jgi:AcrR family transcriptional regulator
VQNRKRRAKQLISKDVDDGRLARGQSTRELILVTAERLFAEFGIAAVSLRDVATAAGQKNNAVVHYHFGDKENLVKEIALYRVKLIEERSTEIQAQLHSGRNPPQVADYVRSFVLPNVRNIEEGNYYLPFISRFIIERGGISKLMDSATIGSDLLRKGLRKVLHNLPEETIEQRWQIVVISVVHSLASYQTAYRSGRAPTVPLEHLLDDLIRFHTAGLKAAPRPASQKANAAVPPYPRFGVRTKPKDSER